MRFHIILLAMMLLMPLLLAFNWSDGTSTDRVCFDVYGSGTIYPKNSTNPSWTIFDVAVLKNGSFWNTNLYGDGFYFFKYSENASHVFLAIPALNATNTQHYCIYSGGDLDSDRLDTEVSYRYYNDSKGSWVGSGCNPYWGDNLSVNSTNTTCRISRAMGTTTSDFLYAKVKLNFTTIGSSSYFAVGMSSSNTSCTHCFRMNSTKWWAIGSSGTVPVYRDNASEDRIVKIAVSNTTGLNVTVFSGNMTYLGNNTTTTASSNNNYFNLYPYEPVAQSVNGSMDWMFAGKVSALTYYSYASSEVFDSQDTNISFVAPPWGTTYNEEDTVLVAVRFYNTFDTCNLSLNGVVIDTYSPLAGSVEETSFPMTNATVGDNELLVNCSLAGEQHYRYNLIGKLGSSSDDVFNLAFGFTPADASCAPAVQLELLKCDEGYNLSTRTDFAAVICPNANFSLNYTCLNISAPIAGVNKNGTVIFFRPESYIYPNLGGQPNLSIEHIGANFIRYGGYFVPGIEIISTNYNATGHGYFVYIPAQLKDRDCNVNFSSGANLVCSWGNGFIINTGDIIVSDRENRWFTAGGFDIVTPFTSSISMQTPPTSVYPITQEGSDIFAEGIYTRLGCFVDVRNESLVINIHNTVKQNYSIYILSSSGITNTTNDPTYAYSYDRVVNMTGLEQVIVYDSSGDPLCMYNDPNLFLPVNLPLPDMVPAGYTILLWAMMIFMVVLTAMVPFAMILVVIWNDVYQLLNMSEVSIIVVITVFFGFVNASFNMERGLKHMLVIVCIAAGYLSLVSTYASDAGISTSIFEPFDNLVLSFGSMVHPDSIGNWVTGSIDFIVAIFQLIFTLPAMVIEFVYILLNLVSWPIWNAALPLKAYLIVGFVLYFYIKAYEVIANRFRPV